MGIANGSSSGGETVKFYIGEGNNIIFVIHKEQILISPVLTAAFSSEFIEGNAQKYRLEDTSEPAFRFVAQWLYNGALQIEDYLRGLECGGLERNNGDHMQTCEYCSPFVRVLLEVWFLGDRFMLPSLQNTVMKALASEVYPHHLLMVNLNYIYENTDSDSQLRRYVVYQSALLNVNPHQWRNNLDLYPKEFLAELACLHGVWKTQIDLGNRRFKMSTSTFYVHNRTIQEGWWDSVFEPADLREGENHLGSPHRVWGPF